MENILLLLDNYDRNLITRLEKENNKHYFIKEIENHYYISQDDLIRCLEDTQDNREFAEQTLADYIDRMENER